MIALALSGAPGEIRTPGLLIRSSYASTSMHGIHVVTMVHANDLAWPMANHPLTDAIGNICTSLKNMFHNSHKSPHTAYSLDKNHPAMDTIGRKFGYSLCQRKNPHARITVSDLHPGIGYDLLGSVSPVLRHSSRNTPSGGSSRRRSHPAMPLPQVCTADPGRSRRARQIATGASCPN